MKDDFAPTETRTDWSMWKKFFVLLVLPNYLFQPWHYKKANVIQKISPGNAVLFGLWPAYYVEVRLDWHREDSQSLYPSWWRERRGFVRISRRLYRQRFLFDINVFCQHHRHYNGTHDVRLRVAR
jgi:hypothetical protein